MKKSLRRMSALLLAFVLTLSAAWVTLATTVTMEADSTTFNVVFVIDESGSMKNTDADLLRYDAVDLFLGLMAQEGNYVGTVSFDDSILYTQEILAVNGETEKATVSEAVRSHTTTGGDTDIGGALEEAVAMLDANANTELPSVIILLTDGNTDLDNDDSTVSEEEEASLEAKAEAIEAARLAGYTIYSVCLNENGEADFSETEQISSATGGTAVEVADASDLQDVFEMFYQAIYSTGSEVLVEGEVPMEATFEIPDTGVGEANIVIKGESASIVLTDPDGNTYTDAVETVVGDITIEKIVLPQAGTWTIKVDGETGTEVQVEIVNNYDFTVTDTSVFEDSYTVGDTVTISAALTDSDGNSLYLEDDSDYSAEVRFVDENDDVIETAAMSVENGIYTLDYEITELDHAYRYYVAVTILAAGPDDNPVRKGETKQFLSGSNTAPVSNGDIEESIKIWPFLDNTYELDLTTLAADAEDDTLSYSVVSSSFIDKADSEEGDYTIEGTTLVQDGYSLRKGSYVIRCTDSGGLYCDVTVTVSSINIGKLTLIGIGIAIAAVLIVVLVLLYMALQRRFYGSVFLRVGWDGEDLERSKNRGRMKLGVFNIDWHGLNAQKSYFQAQGGTGVELVTDKPVTYQGQQTKKVQIRAGGSGQEIILPDGQTKVYVHFVSKLTRQPGAGRGRSGRSAGNRTAGRSAGRSGAGRTGTGGRGKGASSGSRGTRGTRH